MNTRDFRTKTGFWQLQNPVRNPNVWVIGIDIGYSGVKAMSPNSACCFPSYVKKIPEGSINLAKPSTSDILCRDGETGFLYAVGEKAEKMISLDSGADNSGSRYTRNRYFSESFRWSAFVGIALGSIDNKYGSPVGKNLKIQTGLPPAYMGSEDEESIKTALSGRHVFDLKVGAGNWIHFDFTLTPEDFSIMSQPMGALISVCTDRNGVPVLDAQKIFSENSLVFDPGFRTGDTCLIRGGGIDPSDCDTFEGLSMYEIMRRTCRDLNAKGAKLTIPAIQNYLEEGTVKILDISDRLCPKSISLNFTDILQKNCEAVCDEALAKMMEVYNYFDQIDNLIIDGGTGAAWLPRIIERLKGMETLKIISGNANTNLLPIFANARGYYMYGINS